MFEEKQEIYDNLKNYIEKNSKYSPKVLTRAIDNYLPLVVFEEARNELESTSTDYTYKTRILNFNINVYAKDAGSVSSVAICNELSSLVMQVFEEYYHMKGGIIANIPRYDGNSITYQVNIRYTTRYIPNYNKIY